MGVHPEVPADPVKITTSASRSYDDRGVGDDVRIVAGHFPAVPVAHQSALTAAEKAAIRFGELMASDQLSIDDGVYDELREHFSEAQIVELGMWSAFCVGFGRLAATWHMVEELPDAFKDTTRTLSPWNEESIQVR